MTQPPLIQSPIIENLSKNSEGFSDIAMSCSPSAVIYNDKIYVFYQGSNACGDLYYSVYDPVKVQWDHTQILIKKDCMSESPGVTVWNGEIFIGYQGYGADQILAWYKFDPTSNSLTLVEGSAFIYTSPFLGNYKHGGIDTFVCLKQHSTEPGVMWAYYYQEENLCMEPMKLFENCMSCNPCFVSKDGQVNIFVQDYMENGKLRHMTGTILNSNDPQYPGLNFNLESSTVVSHAQMSESPSVVLSNDLIVVFYQGFGKNGNLYYSYKNVNRTEWSAINVVFANGAITDSPSAVTYHDTMYVFCQDSGAAGTMGLSTLKLG